MDQAKLLLISDPEGCKAGQSQVLCSNAMFEAIEAFLTANPKNKVAFLGDYFDHGPLVVNTINNIMNLKNKYDDRIIIILGNRDVNKLRLIYEMNEEPETVSNPETLWPVWSKFYESIIKPQSLHDRFKEILTKSMGASWPPQLDIDLTEHEATFVLLSAFSETASAAYMKMNPEVAAVGPTYADFIKNCRDLFTKGKIVHYDAEYKTLLSNAGGMDTFLTNDITYYESIVKSLQQDEPYYNKIEAVRKALQVKPQASAAFDESVYNSPLKIVESLLSNPPPAPTNEYFLLQGLGLKPDAGNHFSSFIQSGDVQSCRGPMASNLKWSGKSPYHAADYAIYLAKLETAGVKFVASGHSPHCAPLPLIYTKPDDNDTIIFINNDTSNGFRPAEINDVSRVPLCYVSETGTTGVFSLPGSQETTYKGPNNTFSPMVGEWSIDSVPKFLTNPARIQYKDGKQLVFPARLEEAPPKLFLPAKMVGGKRRNKTNKINRTKKIRYNRKRKTNKAKLRGSPLH